MTSRSDCRRDAVIVACVLVVLVLAAVAGTLAGIALGPSPAEVPRDGR